MKELKLSSDLRKSLASSPSAYALWRGLTPIARRDFLSWIGSAKQEETRKKRIDSMPSRLLSGKRRPCCYALVPMNFYKALSGTLRAKTTWKDLTPDEKRDFVAWVDDVKDKEKRGERIEKAVLRLASGKRRPN